MCIVREDPTQNERINIPSQIQMRNSRKAEKKNPAQSNIQFRFRYFYVTYCEWCIAMNTSIDCAITLLVLSLATTHGCRMVNCMCTANTFICIYLYVTNAIHKIVYRFVDAVELMSGTVAKEQSMPPMGPYVGRIQ